MCIILPCVQYNTQYIIIITKHNNGYRMSSDTLFHPIGMNDFLEEKRKKNDDLMN